MSAPASNRVARGDAFSLMTLMAVGSLFAIGIVIGAVLRTIELFSTGPWQVPAEFHDTVVEAPVGEGGATVAIGVERATVTVDTLPGAALVAGVLGQVVLVLMTVTVVGCLLLVSLSILRGRIFSKRNTTLVATAGIVALIGVAAVQFCGNMLSNGALATVGIDPGHHPALSFEPFPFILACFAVATVCTAFTVGARLQRDTEGLV